MGEGNKYYITMLVTVEQENAIRAIFKRRNWTCLINVVSEEIVPEIQRSFTHLFPHSTSYKEGNVADSTFEHDIRSEIHNKSNDWMTSDIKVDTSLTQHEHASGTDICNNDSSVSDHRTQKLRPSNNIQSTETIKEISEKEGMNTGSDFSTSDEETSTHTMKLPDKEKDTRESHSHKTVSNQTNSGPKKKKFKCSICDKYLASKPSLQRHCQRRHQNEWYEFKCKDCSCMFKKLEELWQHRNEVKHEPPKKQPKFSEKKNLSPEELEQLGHLKCNACDKILPSRRLLRRHFYSDHREWMPDPICAVCGTEFKNRQELWKHKRETKHNDSLTLLQTYQCEECGKILSGGYHSFKLHQKYACQEVTEPQAKCDICGSMFKSQTHVQQHKQRTHLESPEVCDICGAVCKNKHALNSHKRRHDEKNKKFVCDNCGKAFLTGLLLKMHVRTHTKEKPFKCPLCNYRCAIKQNIQKHSVNVHKTQVRCADIVTVKENDVKEASDNTYPVNERNGEIIDETIDLNYRTSGFSGRKAVSDEARFRFSDSVIDSDSRHFHSTDHRDQSSSLSSPINTKALSSSDKSLTADNKAVLSSDIAAPVHEKSVLWDSESQLKNQGNVPHFFVTENAKSLTTGRQGETSNSDRSQKMTDSLTTHLNTGSASSVGSYLEMMNCALNQHSYMNANSDPPQYPNPWSHTSNR